MPPPVVALMTDLFLQSRIAELSGSIGVDTKFVANEKELNVYLSSTGAKLVILDLAATEYDPFSCAQLMKQAKQPPKIFAFFPHVKTALKKRAESVGIDYVVPNSNLLSKLRTVLISMAESR